MQGPVAIHGRLKPLPGFSSMLENWMSHGSALPSPLWLCKERLLTGVLGVGADCICSSPFATHSVTVTLSCSGPWQPLFYIVWGLPLKSASHTLKECVKKCCYSCFRYPLIQMLWKSMSFVDLIIHLLNPLVLCRICLVCPLSIHLK